MPSSWSRGRESRLEASRSWKFGNCWESCAMAGGSESVGFDAVFLWLGTMDEQDPEGANAASRTTVSL